MATKTTTDPLAGLEDRIAQAVAAALAGTSQVQARQASKPLENAVRLNTGTEATKFGILSMGKIRDGEFVAKMNLRTKTDVQAFIKALQAAYKELA